MFVGSSWFGTNHHGRRKRLVRATPFIMRYNSGYLTSVVVCRIADETGAAVDVDWRLLGRNSTCPETIDNIEKLVSLRPPYPRVFVPVSLTAREAPRTSWFQQYANCWGRVMLRLTVDVHKSGVASNTSISVTYAIAITVIYGQQGYS